MSAADRIHRLGYASVGIDISGRLVALGRSRYPGLKLIEADAEELPFDSNSPDGVLLSGLLHHFPDHLSARCTVFEDIKHHYELSKITISLFGMAFKTESDDIRASLSYKFKKVLTGQARGILTADPFVTTDPELRPLGKVMVRSNSLNLCVPHRAYRMADFMGKPVFDIWGQLESGNIIR